MTVKEDAVEALKEVMDPELGVDVWTLGLIYELEIDESSAFIQMTFTSPFCPYAPALQKAVEQRVKSVDGVEDVEIEITMDPPWEPPEDIKAMLGLGGGI